MCCQEFTQAPATAADVSAVAALVYSPVANLAALATAAGVDGAVRRVLSLRDTFVATNRASPRSTDTAAGGATVAAHPGGGNWRWERLEQADPSWLTQAVWEVDTSTGNDEADGLTSGTAVKSFDEVMRRCAGLGRVWDAGAKGAATVTVNLRGNGHVLVGKVHVRNGLKFVINGVRTVATTGITGTPTNLNRATNAYTEVASTWTVASELGRLLKDVTNNRYSWVYVDNGGTAGVDDRALIPPWSAINEAGTPGISNGNSTAGAALETYTLPTITNYQLAWSGSAGSTSSITLQNVEILSTAGTARAFSENAQPFYQNVKFGGNIRFGFGTHILHNCWLAGDAAYAIDAHAYVRIVSGVSTVAWVGSAASRPQCSIELRNDVLFGVGITVPYGCRLRVLDAWFRNVTACITLTQGSSVNFGGNAAGSLNGAGNTTAVVMNGGTDMTYTSGTAWNISCTNFITVGASTTARAFDSAAGVHTAARTLSAANLVATVAAGGFGGSLNDPVTGCRVCLDS